MIIFYILCAFLLASPLILFIFLDDKVDIKKIKLNNSVNESLKENVQDLGVKNV